MNQPTTHPKWMDDILVRDIPKEKLDFLEKMFAAGQGKKQKELMRILLPMIQKAKQENLTFTPQEMSAAISAIQKYSSEEELKQIQKILQRGKH